LPAQDGLPLVRLILERNLDRDDPHIPLLAWWAIEAHVVQARDPVLRMFGTPEAWQAPLVRDVILERLMRRCAAKDSEVGLTACARLLAAAPASGRSRLLAAMDKGLQDRPGRPHKNAGTQFNDIAVVETPVEARHVGTYKVPGEL